jgi:hypothetical protein
VDRGWKKVNPREKPTPTTFLHNNVEREREREREREKGKNDRYLLRLKTRRKERNQPY